MAVPTINEATVKRLQALIVESRNKVNDYEANGFKKTDAWKAEVQRMNELIVSRDKLLAQDKDDRTEFRVRGYTVYATIVMLSDALNHWERQAGKLWEMQVDGEPTAICRLIEIERHLMSELYKIVERVGGCGGAEYAREFADMVDDATDAALSQTMNTMRETLIRHGAKKLVTPKQPK